MAKVGIFGGAFDPPHKQHFLIAKAAALELGLQKIVFLPSNNPPHKNLFVTGEDRIKMLNLGIAKYFGNDASDKCFDFNAEICDFEMLNAKTNYTVNTLDKMRELYGDDLYFIVGGDSIVDFYKWRDPHKILQKAKIVCAARQGLGTELAAAISSIKTDFNADILLLNYCPKSISSTQLRLDLKIGIDCSDDITQDVYLYIKHQHLYNEYSDILKKLEYFCLDKKTIDHTKRTARYALLLNKKLNIDDDKVIKAALLHDCAKHYTPTSFELSQIPQDSIGTPVAHAFIGKIVAQNYFNITDNEVLDAIYFHTTGAPEMSDLQKLIYLSDMLEPKRSFDGIDDLRNLASDNFDKAFVMCVNHSYNYLLSQKCAIYPLTILAQQYYKSKFEGDINGN